MSRRGPSASGSVIAVLFFLAATVVFTWPVAPRAGSGLADLWDAKLNAWILHWDFHQTFRDPIHLYDANIFYPSRYALAFSENLFGAALFGFPLYAAGASTLLAYNLVFLLGMLLSAMAAWALARDVTGDPVASVAAGLVYAFCPWRIAQIPHIQFQWGAFLALALLFLLRYLDGGRRRDVVLFGVCFVWNALCNVHYALFSGFLIAVVLAHEGLVSRTVAYRSRLGGVFAALAVAGLLLVPFFTPYALASKLYGMERGIEEIGVFSAVPTDFLTAGGQNRLYAPLTEKWAKAEGELFPGLAPVALAVLALARRRHAQGRPEVLQASPGRRRLATALDVLLVLILAVWVAALTGRGAIGPLKIRDPGRIAVFATALVLLRLAAAFPRWSRFADLGDFLRRIRFGARAGLFLAIAITGILVAFGTHTPYYRFLVESFGPVFRVIRAPMRGVVLFDLGLSLLAAWGLSELIRGRRPATRLAIMTAAILVIGFEYRAFPVNVRPLDPDPAPVHSWLATVSFPGGVVEWPLGTWYEQEHEFRSTAHWKPIVNGASGFSPRSYDELAAVMEKKPIPDAVWEMLAQRRATLLLFHSGEAQGEIAMTYAAAVERGVKEGRLELLRSFWYGESRDFVFRLASASALGLPAAGPEQSRRDRAALAVVLNPPFGYIDVPGQGETVAVGAGGFGWALDDSGIKRVTVTADDGPPLPAQYGGPHPGPAKVYPEYPDASRAGFNFAIPSLAPGPHTLTVTIVAKDGGRTTMAREIVVK
jgi:hypothetical protein